MTTSRSDYQRNYRQQYKAHAKRVNLTFSLAEYRTIARAAEGSGEAVAAYVKRLALEAHESRVEPPEEVAEALADLDRVIRTIANNVNQMARHANRIAHVLDEQEVFLHIATLQEELRAATTRLSREAGRRAETEDGS